MKKKDEEDEAVAAAIVSLMAVMAEGLVTLLRFQALGKKRSQVWNRKEALHFLGLSGGGWREGQDRGSSSGCSSCSKALALTTTEARVPLALLDLFHFRHLHLLFRLLPLP
jgi:hypothetical protein